KCRAEAVRSAPGGWRKAAAHRQPQVDNPIGSVVFRPGASQSASSLRPHNPPRARPRRLADCLLQLRGEVHPADATTGKSGTDPVCEAAGRLQTTPGRRDRETWSNRGLWFGEMTLPAQFGAARI